MFFLLMNYGISLIWDEIQSKNLHCATVKDCSVGGGNAANIVSLKQGVANRKYSG